MRWSTAFGRVSFDSKAGVFEYAKAKKSDLEAAMNIAPADYVKESNAKPEAAFDEIAELEKVIKRFAEKGASMRTLNALKAALSASKVGVIATEEPKAAPVVKKARAVKVAPVQELAEAA